MLLTIKELSFFNFVKSIVFNLLLLKFKSFNFVNSFKSISSILLLDKFKTSISLLLLKSRFLICAFSAFKLFNFLYLDKSKLVILVLDTFKSSKSSKFLINSISLNLVDPIFILFNSLFTITSSISVASISKLVKLEKYDNSFILLNDISNSSSFKLFFKFTSLSLLFLSLKLIISFILVSFISDILLLLRSNFLILDIGKVSNLDKLFLDKLRYSKFLLKLRFILSKLLLDIFKLVNNSLYLKLTFFN